MNGSQCPACGAEQVFRSRSVSMLERVRKRLTRKRLYRCARCAWRGWLREGHARAPLHTVVPCAPPRFDLIDEEFDSHPSPPARPPDGPDRPRPGVAS
jgi:hypothetical protein